MIAALPSEAGRLIRILLVEDSPEDVLLTRESLKEAKVANELDAIEIGSRARRP